MPRFPLDVLPVVDLQGGVVVRGVGGRRDEYRPIVSRLASDASPASIARGFARAGFDQLYVADLDAISGAEPDSESYRALAAAGLSLWIDAGAGEMRRAAQMAELVNDFALPTNIVLGLESLGSLDALDAIYTHLDPRLLVFSLDLREGQPLCGWLSAGERHSAGAELALAIVEHAIRAGAGRIIVLDLARVGGADGAGQLELLRAIHSRWPRARLISGGGVRSREDLESLRAAGCGAALVASALHDGSLLEAREPLASEASSSGRS